MMSVRKSVVTAAFVALAGNVFAGPIKAIPVQANYRQALEVTSMVFMSEVCRQLSAATGQPVTLAVGADPDVPDSLLTRVYAYNTEQKTHACGRAIFAVPVGTAASEPQMAATEAMVETAGRLAKDYVEAANSFRPGDKVGLPLMKAYAGLRDTAEVWQRQINQSVALEAQTSGGKPTLIDMYYRPPRPGGDLEMIVERVRRDLWRVDQWSDPSHYEVKPAVPQLEVRWNKPNSGHALT